MALLLLLLHQFRCLQSRIELQMPGSEPHKMSKSRLINDFHYHLFCARIFSTHKIHIPNTRCSSGCSATFDLLLRWVFCAKSLWRFSFNIPMFNSISSSFHSLSLSLFFTSHQHESILPVACDCY